MVSFQRILYFPRIQRGSNIFQGCPTFFQGVQMLISKETHLTCDFPGGGGEGLGPYSFSGSAHELH